MTIAKKPLRILASASVEQRTKYIELGCIIDTNVRKNIKQVLTSMVAKRSVARHKLLFLTAPPGMGVSTILQQFAEKHPVHIDQKTGNLRAPVICEAVHGSGAIDDYCIEVNRQIGAPRYGINGAGTALSKTLHKLELVDTKLMIIDDFERTYSFKRDQQKSYRNYVYYLMSKHDISVVLTGTPKIWKWAIDDEQIMGRSLKVEYEAWKQNDPDFIEFLQKYEKWCPVQLGAALSNDSKFRRALIRKTHGICQEVVRELKQLSIFAIMSGKERLDFDVWISMHNRLVS